MPKPTKAAANYAAIIIWMFMPMIPVAVASAIASSCGCQLDEGDVHPCIVFGKDIGKTLYQMGMFGWFGLLTFPTGLIALFVAARKNRKEHSRGG